MRPPLRVFAPALLALAVLLSGAGCDPSDDDGAAGPRAPGAGGKADNGDPDGGTPEPFRLAGFDETVLMGDADGTLALARVGSVYTQQNLDAPFRTSPSAMRRHGGRFHLLYADGTLLVIDPGPGPAQEPVAQPAKLPVTKPYDLEFVTDSVVYLALAKEAKVVKVDLESRTILSTIALGSYHAAGEKVEPHRLLLVGQHLFVQLHRTKSSTGREAQGAMAVVDAAQDAVIKVLDLTGFDPVRSQVIPAINPDLPMVFDALRNKVLVTARGIPNADTGMIVRIDAASLELDPYSERAQAGYQGAIAGRSPLSRLFVIYHTHTPVYSSHLFYFDVADDGAMTLGPGRTLVDAFDGRDQVHVNDAGTLAVMVNTCKYTFCMDGAGLNFVDAARGTILPKLRAEVIGFEPSWMLFQ
jgi:prepilin-type processing-associated H-X9-DG protein